LFRVEAFPPNFIVIGIDDNKLHLAEGKLHHFTESSLTAMKISYRKEKHLAIAQERLKAKRKLDEYEAMFGHRLNGLVSALVHETNRANHFEKLYNALMKSSRSAIGVQVSSSNNN